MSKSCSWISVSALSKAATSLLADIYWHADKRDINALSAKMHRHHRPGRARQLDRGNLQVDKVYRSLLPCLGVLHFKASERKFGNQAGSAALPKVERLHASSAPSFKSAGAFERQRASCQTFPQIRSKKRDRGILLGAPASEVM